MRFTKVYNLVGCHAEGEVGNVVVGGMPALAGDTMFEKMQYLESDRDDIRKLLLREPRGNVIRSTNIVLPSSHPEAHMGYIIMESTEYPVMSGSNTICVATVLLETGMVPMVEPVTNLVLESPAGLIRISCQCKDGKVTQVRFINQPAFAYHLDAEIDVPDVGRVTVDVAWGGMTYVLIDAEMLGFEIVPSEARKLSELGQVIKKAAAEQLSAVHPENPAYAGITQTEFTRKTVRTSDGVRGRNAVIVSPGRIDRCPCGTGTSARLAILHAKGELAIGERFISESIIGSTFDCAIESETKVGDIDAVIPSVAGQGYITDFSQVGFDPADPFPEGYELADTWLT